MKKYAIRLYISTIMFGKLYHNIAVSAENENEALEKVKEINPNAVVVICQLMRNEAVA